MYKMHTCDLFCNNKSLLSNVYQKTLNIIFYDSVYYTKFLFIGSNIIIIIVFQLKYNIANIHRKWMVMYI